MPRIATFKGTPSDRPAAHLLERRSDDANQVTVVLAAEIGLDLPTVVFYGSHRTSPEITRARAAPSRTSSAPVSSMSSATPWRVTPATSHSTRRPNVDTARSRHRAMTRRARAGLQLAVAQVQRGQALDEQQAAIDRPSELGLDRRRPRGDIGGYAAGIRLMPQPSTTCGPPAVDVPASARMPASLRPSDVDIVRPLEMRMKTRGRLNPVRERHAGGNRQQTDRMRGRPHDDGHVDAGARRRRPGATVTPASRRLCIRDDDGPFRLAAIRSVAATSLVEPTSAYHSTLPREDPGAIAGHASAVARSSGTGRSHCSAHRKMTPDPISISKLRSAAGAECVSAPIDT